jgi:hypothetical protein
MGHGLCTSKEVKLSKRKDVETKIARVTKSKVEKRHEDVLREFDKQAGIFWGEHTKDVKLRAKSILDHVLPTYGQHERIPGFKIFAQAIVLAIAHNDQQLAPEKKTDDELFTMMGCIDREYKRIEQAERQITSRLEPSYFKGSLSSAV